MLHRGVAGLRQTSRKGRITARMRAGFNPTRRNRNIGTAKQGHGADNRMKIPVICGYEREWWEQIRTHKVAHGCVLQRDIQFFIEATRGNCIHACTVADICHILSAVPENDWNGLHAFILRQSTRKEWLINPTWGRLAFTASVGQPGRPNLYSGPAIILEAVDPFAVWTWDKSLSPAEARELERLGADGHQVRDCGKYYKITSDATAVRATQLYRTILHEIGHWVDWLQKVERPGGDPRQKFDERRDLYFARPEAEREMFANRYADRMREKLLSESIIPFN